MSIPKNVVIDCSPKVPSIISECFATNAVRYGLGEHLDAVVREVQAKQFLLYTWWTIWMVQIALPIGKTAVASFMLVLQARKRKTLNTGRFRLYLHREDPRRRYFLHFIAISNVVANVPLLVVILF